MAECAVCRKKLGFMGGNTLENRVSHANVSLGSITVCDDCIAIMNALKEGDFDAYITVHKSIEKNKDRTLADFVKAWEKTPTEILQLDEKTVKEIVQLDENITKEGISTYLHSRENARLAKIEKEEKKVAFAKSFQDFYEYDVTAVVNKKDGVVDTEKLKEVLSIYAEKGWKLHTIYSNELGKNALSIMGLGVNSTASQDVLIFERRIQNDSER